MHVPTLTHLQNAEDSDGSRISRRRGGGADLVGGATDYRGGYFSKILYVKTKESGPLGAWSSGAPWIRHWKPLFLG